MPGLNLLKPSKFFKPLELLLNDDSVETTINNDNQIKKCYIYEALDGKPIVIACFSQETHSSVTSLDAFHALFSDLVNDLSLAGYKDAHIIIPVAGHGLTEEHIVVAYRAPNETKFTLFDPKLSDPSVFVSEKSVLRRIPAVITGVFRSLFNLHYTETNIPYHGDDSDNQFPEGVDYAALGRQSLFDGIKCGYDVIDIIMAMKALLVRGDSFSVNDYEKLREELAKDEIYNTVKNYVDKQLKSSNSDDLKWTSFIKQAWRDTFVPTNDDREFKHYFLGWPYKQGTAAKVIYVLSLGFILKPIVNAVKVLTEFLIKAVTETFNWARHNLMAWGPMNPAAQYLRSGLLFLATVGYGVFEFTRLIVRAILSPVNSYSSAKTLYEQKTAADDKRFYFAMMILSVTTSVIGITAIAIFAGPLLLMASPAISAGASALIAHTIGVIGANIVALFTASSLPVVAAMVTSVVIGASVAMVKGIAGLLNYGFKPKVQQAQKIEPAGDKDGFVIKKEKQKQEDDGFVFIQPAPFVETKHNNGSAIDSMYRRSSQVRLSSDDADNSFNIVPRK